MSNITRWITAYEGDFEETFDTNKKWPANSSILELRMFDVGAGEAIFIIFPSRTVWLIDGGSAAGRQDTGEMLADYLISHNLKLTRIIASHPHKDHVGSVEFLLRKNPPLGSMLRFYFTDDTPEKNAKKGWLNDLKEELEAKKTELIDLTSGNEMINLPNNSHAFLFAGSGRGDYTSIFMHFVYRKSSFIFTGDVDKFSYENGLLELYKDEHFRSHVLKLTHHGNKGGTGKDFVAAVEPAIAIASTASDGGHTLDYQVKKRLRDSKSVNKNNCEIFQTLKNGNIVIQTNGKQVTKNGRTGVLYNVTVDK